MSADRESRIRIGEIRNGPRLQSVVITRQSHQGMSGYELLVRRKGEPFLTPIVIWLTNPEGGFNELYDEIFDLTYECLAKLLEHDLRLFED